jgi:methionyl-tRNA formyltransferase
MASKLRVAVLGEKPQGAEWLKLMLDSNLFEIVCGVPRHLKGAVWWGEDDFRSHLESHRIPIIQREELENYRYDIIWSLMYGFIIEEKWIKRAEFGVNLHESPLPRYRGCNGYSHAILANDTTYGTTLHLLDPELDRGAMIEQEIFPIESDETAKELYNRTRKISRDLFARKLRSISEKNFNQTPFQVIEEPIRARSSLIDEKSIECFASFEDLYRRARALDFVPFEPLHIEMSTGRYYIFVNGSEGRKDHLEEAIEIEWPNLANIPIMKCSLKNRVLIVMNEKVYSNYYPIFQTAAERKRGHGK